MKPYELTYILSSSLTTQEADTQKKELEVFVQEKEGVILKSEKTAPQGLAYTVKKNHSGYFLTLEFQFPEKTVKELKEKLQKDVRILRHFLMVKKPIKVMKKRRIKKPAITHDRPAFAKDSGQVKEKPVNIEDIDKKLDEILSE